MRLEQKRAEHTPEIKAHVAKAVALAEQVERDMPVLAEVAPWSATYLAEVEHTAEQARARFGATLADALQRHNMTLSGQYPLLKVGLFVLQLDFDKNRVTIWYGPRQERLAQCHARVSDVVQSITTTRDALGSSLPEHDLLARLQTAYRRANDNRPGESIPLVAVLSELAPLMQEPQWRHDPQQQHYRSYGRAAFSYDLYRLRCASDLAGSAHRPHLSIATREQTKQRETSLWIPTNDHGDGSMYALIQFPKESLV
jgi:hypothetical protein